MRAPQNLQKWALMVFVEERLRFFNVWVEEFSDFRGVVEVTMLTDVMMMRSECLRALC